MGNQTSNKTSKENANVDGHKVFLSLRCRDIILHYSYKMKLTITDISLFPHGLEGLRLWDQDVILSRYVILQNEKFKNKSAFVFKGGVGIVGIALSKWGGCKKIDMCDTRPEVVGNMTKNCQRNQIKNVKCFEVNLAEFGKYSQTYDFALATDLFSQGFQPHVILNIWRKVLRIGGESIMLMPDKKDQCRRLLEIVDRTEFKIQNMLLTADQYEASPLLNKQQGESEFPQIGKTNFYVISLAKLREKSIADIKAEQQELNQNRKTVNKEQQKADVVSQEKKQVKPKEVIMKEEMKQEKSLPVNQKQQNKQIPQQKLVQVQVKIENKEKVQQQLKKQRQSSQKKQRDVEKKVQSIKEEEKMLQMEQEKKMLEMAQEKKMLQMAQEKKMLQMEEQKKMLQMEEQKRMLEAEEKKAVKNEPENKTYQVKQVNKVQQVQQENKPQNINQEQSAEVTQPMHVKQQKQQQTESKEQNQVQVQAQAQEEQLKQQTQQQPKVQQKTQEKVPKTTIPTEKAENEQEAKEETPAQNIQYNLNEEEIVYDGYVPSEDQKNQPKRQQIKETNQQQPQVPNQAQNCQECHQVPVQQKQHQEHKQTIQTNPQAL